VISLEERSCRFLADFWHTVLEQQREMQAETASERQTLEKEPNAPLHEADRDVEEGFIVNSWCCLGGAVHVRELREELSWAEHKQTELQRGIVILGAHPASSSQRCEFVVLFRRRRT